MRNSGIFLLIVITTGLMSCDRTDRANHDRPAAREVGREAYRASQEVKKDAREAGRELRDAGKEFRQGWNDAKHTDRTTRQK